MGKVAESCGDFYPEPSGAESAVPTSPSPPLLPSAGNNEPRPAWHLPSMWGVSGRVAPPWSGSCHIRQLGPWKKWEVTPEPLQLPAPQGHLPTWK